MTDTYDPMLAQGISLDGVRQLLSDAGAERLYMKLLAPNDNSKNQPYLGGDFSALNILPSGELVESESSSGKSTKHSGRKKLTASLNFTWIAPDGGQHSAPRAQLILYPQYPEVRLSGFMTGSTACLSEWMQPNKRGRTPGRILLLGITNDKRVLGYLAVPGTELQRQLSVAQVQKVTGVFHEIGLGEPEQADAGRELLLRELGRIHRLGWIAGKRLKRGMPCVECNDSNCGGYTLEAELGIYPNGDSAPDFHGWEVKQFGGESFENGRGNVLTLMTPEPSGGVYADEGVIPFLRRYGYQDVKGRADRINFGGVHKLGVSHPRTGLTLQLVGLLDRKGGFEVGGGLQLIDGGGELAAVWHFSKLLDHWKRKHAKAAFVPCVTNKSPLGRAYRYGETVRLGIGTDFGCFLRGLLSATIYYDPGIKMEDASSENPKTKRRNQIRIKVGALPELYHQFVPAEVL
jgi:hypothetical protein